MYPSMLVPWSPEMVAARALSNSLHKGAEAWPRARLVGTVKALIWAGSGDGIFLSFATY